MYQLIDVSITFRLSALSARAAEEKRALRKCAMSQLPFGSVPFRHIDCLPRCYQPSFQVSITFRLSALSALANEEFSTLEEALVSITFRLSALSARVQGKFL